jgi:hypothetical protein
MAFVVSMSIGDESHVHRICQFVTEQDDYWIAALRWIVQEPALRDRTRNRLDCQSKDRSWSLLLLFEHECDRIYLKDVRDEITRLEQGLISLNQSIQESGTGLIESVINFVTNLCQIVN